MSPDRVSIRAALPALRLAGKPREEVALERGLLTGIAAFRWVAWAWSAMVFGLNMVNPPRPSHPEAGIVLLAGALVWTAAAGVLVRRDASMLLDRWALAIELAVAGAMVFFDGFVYGPDSDHLQSLGTVWPLPVVLTAGVAYNGTVGAAFGCTIGVLHGTGKLLFFDDVLGRGDQQLAAAGSIVVYTLAGAIAGFATVKLREAERHLALARARDEVARTLHDGVLQTLAIVQRRAQDPDLVALAREQEQELREYLFTTASTAAPILGRRNALERDLVAALRSVAVDAERRHGVRVTVVATEDIEPLPEATVTAVRGAVGEALTNAAKHGAARTATVFVEPTDDGRVFCSVKDDGTGFDPVEATEGVGITRSIRGRITEVDGTVEVAGRPGRGAEVRLWVPVA